MRTNEVAVHFTHAKHERIDFVSSMPKRAAGSDDGEPQPQAAKKGPGRPKKAAATTSTLTPFPSWLFVHQLHMNPETAHSFQNSSWYQVQVTNTMKLKKTRSTTRDTAEVKVKEATKEQKKDDKGAFCDGTADFNIRLNYEGTIKRRHMS